MRCDVMLLATLTHMISCQTASHVAVNCIQFRPCTTVVYHLARVGSALRIPKDFVGLLVDVALEEALERGCHELHERIRCGNKIHSLGEGDAPPHIWRI